MVPAISLFLDFCFDYLKVMLTFIWNVGGPFLTPNGITIQTKAPQFITKVVLYISSRAIEI
jgi:hypothetical protein